jgi:hypothetical protein
MADMLNNLKKAFLEPSDEFTPAPFWFLNDTLDESEISRQINDFKSKGNRLIRTRLTPGFPDQYP